MATFFDPSKVDDLDLLHSSVRDDSELTNVVNKVEYEMIDYFRQRPNIPLYFRSGFENLSSKNRIKVRLIGYSEDDPAQSNDDLKEALRRSIAYVVSYILRNYDNLVGAQSIKQGQRSVSYHGAIPDVDKWPDGWKRYLRNFDDREAHYSI